MDQKHDSKFSGFYGFRFALSGVLKLSCSPRTYILDIPWYTVLKPLSVFIYILTLRAIWEMIDCMTINIINWQ